MTPKQYPVWVVILIWAAAAIPMGVLSWVITPALMRHTQADVLMRLAALTVGLVWQFCLVILLLRGQNGRLRLRDLTRLLWLVKPSNPRSGKPSGAMWWWLIPLIVVTAAYEMKVVPLMQQWWTSLFPFFAEPTGYGVSGYLSSSAGKAQMVGAWGILVLFVTNALFNTFLGEELLFRGLLLPRMQGSFGGWSWIANGMLFGLYHFHQPWGMLSSIVSGTLLFALSTKIFKSSWFGIVLHSGQSLFFTFIMIGMVLGLA